MRDKDRTALADAAAARKDQTGASYSTALDEVLTEFATAFGLDSKTVYRTLLNVPTEKPVLKRHQNKTSPDDISNESTATTPGPQGPPSPDDSTHA